MQVVRYIPILAPFFTVVIISFTLYLTINQNHVTDSLPYISDTGTIPPESCIFGQVMNLMWVLISIAMFIKYRQVTYLTDKNSMETEEMLNRKSLAVGWLAAFGSSIVGNFQETNMFFIHWFGAILVFGLGSVYQCMQTKLGINLMPILGQKKLVKWKLGLAVLSTISFVIFFVCAMTSYYLKEVNDNYLHWKKEDGGYEFHNISVVFEWICASSTLTYLSLFSEDFRNISINGPEVVSQTALN